MKRISIHNLWIIILFALMGCISCEDKNEGSQGNPAQTVVSIAANPLSLAFDSTASSQDITITSDGLWKLNYTTGQWYRPTISSANGNATIAISVDENPAKDTRTGKLTLSAQGADSITINISQTGVTFVAEPKDTAQTELGPDNIPADNTDMRDLTTIELSKLMGIGWNVGNSMEALSINNDIYSGDETSWGNPIISQQLMDSVKAAGFNTIRIPVSWSHQLVAGTTYEIRTAWLRRVEEVVNYVISNGMYAMINTHWDGGWADHPFYNKQDEINERLEAYWKQIAVYFRDYNDHLLFAGTNEVHIEGDYSDPNAENVAVQNSFNKTFVETVRATGGRNTYRHLIVQSYNTNILHAKNHMVVPTDPTPNRLMVEVHFYDPYGFSLQESGGKTQWGAGYTDVDSWGQEAWVDEVFGYMKTYFVDKGFAVIMGEYGALWRNALTGDALAKHEESRNYYLNYVTKKALENGMVPVYWDNGHRGNNGFALFKRSTGEQVNPGAVTAIVSAASK